MLFGPVKGHVHVGYVFANTYSNTFGLLLTFFKNDFGCLKTLYEKYMICVVFCNEKLDREIENGYNIK